LPPPAFDNPAVFINQCAPAVLVAFFPLAFIVFPLIIFRPGELAKTMILALEPRAFIPASRVAIPGAFSVGQPVFSLAGIFARDSTRHFKNK